MKLDNEPADASISYSDPISACNSTSRRPYNKPGYELLSVTDITESGEADGGDGSDQAS